jgi:hypothetical protein
MTGLQTLWTTGIGLTLLLVAAPTAQADYHHIDQLALRMERQARELISEVDAHYRHHSMYRHLRSDSVGLYRLARHIHELAHHQGPSHHLRADLDSADHRQHQIQSLVAQSAFAPLGHTHGNVGHLRRRLGQMERTLHHLRDDVAQLTTPHPVPHYGGDRHGHGPAIGFSWGSGGVYFNGQRGAVRFNVR